MAGRVSQLPVQVSGSGQTPLARVSQLPVQVSGSGQTPLARVSQLVVQISSPVGIAGIATFSNVNTFPAGGTVATNPAIPVIQNATFQNVNTFPAGGSLDVMTPLPVVQAATYSNTNSFPAGGQVAFIVPPPPVTPGSSGGIGSSTSGVVGDLKRNRFTRTEYNAADQLLMSHANLVRSMFYPAQGSPVVQTLNGLGGLGSTWGPEQGSIRDRQIPLIQSSGVPGPDSIYVSSRQFFEKGSIVTPIPLAGDVQVLEFKVPTGYWGKILGMYLHYTGLNFVPGSGDIIWRVQIGRRWMKGFGNVRFNMGSFENTSPVSQWQGLNSQKVVRVWVNVPNLSGLIQVGASYILAGVQGWFYSNEEIQ